MNARRRLKRRGPVLRARRGRVTALLCAALCLVLVAGPLDWRRTSFAQESRASDELKAKLDQPGTIMLRDATLADWLFAVKQEWDINIVASGDLQREPVDGVFKDTSLRDILSEILNARGYAYEAVGNTLRVIRSAEIGAVQPDFQTEIIELEFLKPDEAEPSVKLLLSPKATVQSVPSSRSLIVIDLPQRIHKIRQHLKVLEDNARRAAEEEAARRRAAQRPSGGPNSPDGTPVETPAEKELIEVFTLEFIDAESVVPSIQAVAPTSVISVMRDENRLVVRAPESQMEKAVKLLKRLDVPRRQLRITALLYDVNLEVMERLGFNWRQAGRGRINATGDPGSLFELNSTNFSEVGSVSGGGGGDAGAAGDMMEAASSVVSAPLGGLLTLSHLSRHFDLTAVVQALDTTEGARLLARPNIIGIDGVEAVFESVSEIPVQQLTETSEGGSIGTTQFREAGIKLTVTPRIMNDGSVILQVTPEFSVLAGFQNGQPVIDRRRATTTVHMANGQTSVIGGLLRRNELENQRSVPGLGRWKYLGTFFRDHESTVTESELLVFIRAEIIEMGQVLKPREQTARGVLDDLLDQVPYASHEPITPPCNDPYCPYHNPRPWGGNLYLNGPCSSGKSGGWYDGPPQPASPGEPIPAPDGHSDAAAPPPIRLEEAQFRRFPSTQQVAVRRLPPVPAVAPERLVAAHEPQLPSRRAQPLPPPADRTRVAAGGSSAWPPAEQPRTAVKRTLLDNLFRR